MVDNFLNEYSFCLHLQLLFMFYSAKNIIKEITTSTVTMRLLDMGMIHYSYLNNVDIDVDLQMENHKALVELAGTEKLPLLVDAAELINFTAEARAKVKELEPISPILVRAFVTKSIGHKLLINFFLKVNKPYVQNKVFSNYEEAASWLMQFKSVQNQYI